MESDRTSYQLDFLCDFINGFAFKSTDYVERSSETIEVLRMGYISRGGGFKEDTTPVFVPKAYAKNIDKYLVRPDDIVIAMTDMKDKVAILANTARINHAERFVLNQRVGCIRVRRTDLVCPKFLYYYTNWQPHVDYLRSRANSGVQVNLSTAAIRGAEIELPPLEDQLRIGSILSGLDDRIDLLRQTNTTLEAIAQALFKSWFVDFDPVHAKAEGREPLGMDAVTAALFPGEFEASELGLIPKGWPARSLDSIANYLNGLALQKFPPESDDEYLPVIKIAQLRAGNTSSSDRASARLKPDYVVHDGDVLFSWSGSLEVELWCGNDGALNQHLFKVTSDEVPKWFYYLATRLHLPEFRQVAASKATTMGHIQRQHLTRAKVAVPPSKLMAAATEIIEPLIERWITNALQARELVQLRDTLLPRLISGKLRLPETEAQIADAIA
jgi:type I restriction enzyme S subunit